MLTKHGRSAFNWDDFFGEKTSGGRNLSGFWRSRWQRDDDAPLLPDGRENPIAFTRHLQSLRNTCALVFGRKQLQVDWASEDDSYTDISLGLIRLSPRPLKDNNKVYADWTLDDRLDVLQGTALHEGAHNQWTPAESMVTARNAGGQMLAELFNLIEDGYIEAEVMDEFPGFSGYFDQMNDFYFHPEEIQSRIRALLETDLTKIDTTKEITPELLEKLVKQVSSFVNVLIAACKSRNEVDLTPLYARGGRYEQVAMTIDKIVKKYRSCEQSGIAYDERLDAARYAYRAICNLFDKPIGDNEEPTVGGFVLNGKLGDQKITEMFSDGGVGASSGRNFHPKAGSENETISRETASQVKGMIDANMRDIDLEAFHRGSEGVLHRKVRIIDMKRKNYSDARYEKMYSDVAKNTQRLRNALKFRSADRVYTERERPYGKVDSTRLTDMVAFGSKDIFYRKTTASAPSAHIEILIDESGSMSESIAINGLPKDITAAQSAIMLEAALRNNKSISYAIWGHTGDMSPMYSYRMGKATTLEADRYTPVPGFHHDGPVLFRYLDSKAGLTDPRVLGRITSRSQNYDGYALEVVYENIQKNAADALRKIIIIICDGMPAGFGYSGDNSIQHTANVVRKARKNGIEVIALFVGSLNTASIQMKEMYGRENYDWVQVPQPNDLPRAVERIAERVLKWNGGDA